jgi:hypothetical protein
MDIIVCRRTGTSISSISISGSTVRFEVLEVQKEHETATRKARNSARSGFADIGDEYEDKRLDMGGVEDQRIEVEAGSNGQEIALKV